MWTNTWSCICNVHLAKKKMFQFNMLKDWKYRYQCQKSPSSHFFFILSISFILNAAYTGSMHMCVVLGIGRLSCFHSHDTTDSTAFLTWNRYTSGASVCLVCQLLEANQMITHKAILTPFALARKHASNVYDGMTHENRAQISTKNSIHEWKKKHGFAFKIYRKNAIRKQNMI